MAAAGDGPASAPATMSRVLRAPTAGLTFEALYYPDLLHAVNSHGDVGIVTLWSPWRTVRRKLEQISPDILDPAASRVAVVANLYGDGLHAMLCNLLYNPQVRHLIAIGQDMGQSTCADIEAFLRDGLEDSVVMGRRVERIRGTDRILPRAPGFDADRLRQTVSFRYLGRLSRPELAGELTDCLDDLPRDDAGVADRLRVDVATGVPDDYEYRPSEVAAHQVVRRRPLDCWQELVVRAARFGRPVELAGGPRLELLNARAVITDPAPDPPEALAELGFDAARFERYQRAVVDPVLPEGISYTYGHRLRAYFDQPGGGGDSLAAAADVLRRDPESRRAFVSLWDTSADLPGTTGDTPCLATLFFRRADGRLSLTATYRAHNLLTAWLENVYGLMAVQRWVAARAGMEPGQITVISHSLGIDPRSPRYELARTIADGWTRDDDVDRAAGKYELREDPNGYFVVSADSDRGVIVAEHRFAGVLVKRYEAERAVTIEQQVAADMAVTLVSHALWLGRELTAREIALRSGRGA